MEVWFTSTRSPPYRSTRELSSTPVVLDQWIDAIRPWRFGIQVTCFNPVPNTGWPRDSSSREAGGRQDESTLVRFSVSLCIRNTEHYIARAHLIAGSRVVERLPQLYAAITREAFEDLAQERRAEALQERLELRDHLVRG